MNQRELRRKFNYMKRNGLYADEIPIIRKDSILISEGFLMCQGVALLTNDLIGLGHFYNYSEFELNNFLENFKRRSSGEIEFVVISGYRLDHDLWTYNLERKGCKKRAEFSDEYTLDDHYRKTLTISHKEAILHLEQDGTRAKPEKEYIKLY